MAEDADLIGGCRWLQFPKFWDDRGALTPVESGISLPFEIRRVFYFYDVPVAESRGAHAHRELVQVLVALSGSFDVIIDDGARTLNVTCDRPWRALYVPPMVWTAQVNFAGGTVGLVFGSEHFSEEDYIRDHAAFLAELART
jgi:hypothetical protein